MTARRLLQIMLVFTGLVFIVGLPPLNHFWPSGWAWAPEQPTYLHMILGIYLTLGVFLLLAARAPEKNVSLIWFTVWSSLIHGTVMAVHSFTDPGQRGHLIGDVAALYFTAIALAILTPRLARA